MASPRAIILVVDDNPTNLKLAADVLEFEGYQVFRASNAREARQMIMASPPDLILMDIQMPGMDGLTFTRELKAGPLTRRIQIVAMTAFAMKGDEQKAMDAGCNGYLTKPIDTRKLPIQVQSFLSLTDAGVKEGD
jgi:CheY-like chemotaxis protein